MLWRERNKKELLHFSPFFSLSLFSQADPKQTSRRMLVRVALTFCESLLPPPGAEPVEVAVDLSEGDSVAFAKEKIAGALAASSSPPSSSSSASPPARVAGEMLLLHFGPNDAVIGRAFAGDPSVDEGAELLGAHSALGWLRQFPRWRLGARPLPAAPPPPGEAAHRAAAQAEGRDPEGAVAEAREKVRAGSRVSFLFFFPPPRQLSPLPPPDAQNLPFLLLPSPPSLSLSL